MLVRVSRLQVHEVILLAIFAPAGHRLNVFLRRRAQVSKEEDTIIPYKKTSDVISPEYKANELRSIRFCTDVITNMSSNMRLYTAFAMHLVGICPNMT